MDNASDIIVAAGGGNIYTILPAFSRLEDLTT